MSCVQGQKKGDLNIVKWELRALGEQDNTISTRVGDSEQVCQRIGMKIR